MSASLTGSFALWAATYDERPSPIAAVEERLLLPRLEQLCARCVLDVGCGTGRWTARLPAAGFDLSWPMLAAAAAKPGLRGRLAVADAVALPVRTATAEVVLCTLTLSHIRRHTAAMREFARILAPGGTLLLTDFHPQAVAAGWRRAFRHDGEVHHLEVFPYTLDQLSTPGLVLRETAEAAIGEPERPMFAQAGRPELYEAARGIPAVQLTWWTRV